MCYGIHVQAHTCLPLASYLQRRTELKEKEENSMGPYSMPLV